MAKRILMVFLIFGFTQAYAAKTKQLDDVVEPPVITASAAIDSTVEAKKSPSTKKDSKAEVANDKTVAKQQASTKNTVKEKDAVKTKSEAATKAEEKTPDPYEVIKNMPQYIDRVVAVCPWRSTKDEHRQGYIRLTRTNIKGVNNLYVQWLQKVPPADETVLATRMIDELKDAPKLSIEMPEQDLHSRSCTLTAKAKSLESKQHFKIKLTLKAAGEYQYELIQMLAVGGL